MSFPTCFFWLLVLGMCGTLIGIDHVGVSMGAEWSLPLAGNTFLTTPAPTRGTDGIRPMRKPMNGGLQWDDPEEVYAVYFHIDRPATLTLGLHGSVPSGRSIISVQMGAISKQIVWEGGSESQLDVGSFDITEPGYVRVEIQGVERSGEVFASLDTLAVRSDTKELKLDYVQDNQNGMFYWGRRGPSVHLRYHVPQEREFDVAYSEVTVPVGMDQEGSFFMANGFGEGYFGMQVNGPRERRILFSVWSPFRTDDPRDIPPDARVASVARGRDVHVGEFGNEGAGGQSYLVYPWEAGKTYRFVTRIQPDKDNHTIYTAWFGELGKDEWRLIASFRRPKTTTYLSGFHSFLENFAPTRGHLERRGQYGNVWVRETNGSWHECLTASFSVDATGSGRHRLDYQGGTEDRTFFLRHCGFFSESTQPGETFTRGTTRDLRPKIDFEALPNS